MNKFYFHLFLIILAVANLMNLYFTGEFGHITWVQLNSEMFPNWLPIKLTAFLILFIELPITLLVGIATLLAPFSLFQILNLARKKRGRR